MTQPETEKPSGGKEKLEYRGPGLGDVPGEPTLPWVWIVVGILSILLVVFMRGAATALLVVIFAMIPGTSIGGMPMAWAGLVVDILILGLVVLVCVATFRMIAQKGKLDDYRWRQQAGEKETERK